MFPELTPPDPIPPLMTTADLRALLGLTGAVEPTDAQIDFARDVGTDVIRDHVGRLLSFGTYTDLFRCVPRGRQLVLSEFPIKTVTSVTVNGSITDASNYEFHVQQGVLWGSSFPHSGEISVVYEAGYVKLPANLQVVLLEFTRRQLQSMGLPSGNVPMETPIKGVSIGNLRMDYAIAPTSDFLPGAISPLVSEVSSQYADTLDAYRHQRKVGAF